MARRTVKVQHNGLEYEAQPVDVVSESLPWSTFLLEDGGTKRVARFAPEGKNLYNVEVQTVMDVQEAS